MQGAESRVRGRPLPVLGERPGAGDGRDRGVREDPARQEVRRDPGRAHRGGARVRDHPRAGGGTGERIHGGRGRAGDSRASDHVRGRGPSRARCVGPRGGHVTGPARGRERDPLAIGIGALGAGVGFGGACLTIVLFLVRILQRTEISRYGESVSEIDPIWGTVGGMLVAVIFSWRRSQGLENIWQRGVISTLSVFGTFFLGILAVPVWHFLQFTGMALLTAGSFALGIAGSRWAVRGRAASWAAPSSTSCRPAWSRTPKHSRGSAPSPRPASTAAWRTTGSSSSSIPRW